MSFVPSVLWFGNTVFPSVLIVFRNSLVAFLNNIFEAFLIFLIKYWIQDDKF